MTKITLRFILLKCNRCQTFCKIQIKNILLLYVVVKMIIWDEQNACKRALYTPCVCVNYIMCGNSCQIYSEAK